MIPNLCELDCIVGGMQVAPEFGLAHWYNVCGFACAYPVRPVQELQAFVESFMYLFA